MKLDVGFYDQLLKNEITYSAQYGPSSRSRYRIIKGIIRKFGLDTSRILEVGASTGDLFLFLLKNFKIVDLLAIDYSSESVRQMKTKGLKTKRIDLLSTARDWQIPKYPTIICSEVLEHIGDDERALANIAEKLDAGGYLLISSPYSMQNWSRIDEVSGHLRRYEKGELEKKIKKAGLQIKRKCIWGGYVFNFYQRLLEGRDDVASVLAHKPSIIKRIFLTLLFYTFYLDDLFISKHKGRTIFILATKKRVV